MIDLVKLLCKAGDGGHGRVSFRREKYVPKGGPDGGMGGTGGSIIVRATRRYNTLQHLVSVRKIEAEPGQAGGKRRKFGGAAEDVIIEVPIGTTLWLLAENKTSRRRAFRTSLEYRLPRGEIRFQQYHLEEEGQPIPEREPDLPEELSEKLKLVELNREDQEVILCQGGFGGRGNEAFKGPDNTTPKQAEYATVGEQKILQFELRLLADVGLVGLPNAGKSTLISVLTEARPKIGNYPFTTLEPHLGVMRLSETRRDDSMPQELVIADIPGLIEGASEGKGLGIQFLRHVEHCTVLVFLVYLEDSVIFDREQKTDVLAKLVWQQYESLLSELEKYNVSLVQKPRVVTLNKTDIYSSELVAAIKKTFAKHKVSLVLLSAATQQGTDDLKQAIVSQLRSASV